jgi:hypothetical protein
MGEILWVGSHVNIPRFIPLAVCLVSLLCGCGDSAMSLTEYTDHITGVEIRASEKGRVLADEAVNTVDFTPEDL